MFKIQASVPFYKQVQIQQNLLHNDDYSKRQILINVVIRTCSASYQHGPVAQSLYFDFKIITYSSGLF
jgi:hypothetical protein